ncbi:MAG: polysaccharide deacetylase family protein [Gaiellaceae bacterium]
METSEAGDDWRLRRRAERRRERRRRRIAAVALAVTVVTAAGGLVWVSAHEGARRSSVGGAQPGRPARPAAATPRQATRRTHPTAARSRERIRPSAATVPILMYHVIAPPPPTAPYPALYVPPAEFEAQMRALAAAGYHAVTLDRVRAAWRGRARIPPRPIVITFDNGYRTQYTKALPILRRLGWVADENMQLSGLPPSQGGLSSRQVRGLLRAGWELDTQGYSHAELIELGPAQLHFEVATARAMIRRRYHVAADWFCYPSGHYNATVIAAVKAAGYVGSTTVVPGWAAPNNDPYRLPRLRVVSGTSPRALLDLIAGTRDAEAAPAAYP